MKSKRRTFIKNIAGGSAGLFILNSATYGNNLYEILNIESSLNQVSFPFSQFTENYNIGEFIPKDQGGKFIQMEILKTEEDKLIVQKIRDGILNKTYGNPIDWELFEKTEIEKSVWLNRFYFLPSFARMYHLTKDTSFVNDMMVFIEKWTIDNPRLADSHERTYNWRDMQVAWRSIHWSWCYFLTENALSKKQKNTITNSLREHAEILLSGFGKQKLNEFNHQSHGALAMLYLGILYPTLKGAKKLVQTGKKILEHHLEHAFYKDGGNVEQMFGYYPFETHIFRDAYLLCSQNNIEPPLNTLPMLEKMGEFLALTAQPNGTMPPVNDSFEMPVLASIELLNKTADTKIAINPDASKYFPDTQIGVIRGNLENNKWYALANPAKDIGAHSHAGRLSFTAWYNNKPLLVDSGCCNYDKPELVNWYRTSQAHNTVIIDGKSDKETSSDNLWVGRRKTQNTITEWVENDSLISCKMTSPPSETANSNVLWSRNIVLVQKQFLVIHDNFNSTEEHTYEILLHFPPMEICIEQETKTIKVFNDTPLEISQANTELNNNLIVAEGLVSVDGEGKKASIATYKFNKKGNANSVLILMPQKKEFTSTEIEQKETEKGIGLRLLKQNGEASILLIKNQEAKELELWGFKTQKSFDVFNSKS